MNYQPAPTIDPKSLIIDWDRETRTFYAEDSTLRANGICPTPFYGRTVIWIQSHRFKTFIPYVQKKINRQDGEIVSWEYYPSFPLIQTEQDVEILRAARGTRLVIFND